MKDLISKYFFLCYSVTFFLTFSIGSNKLQKKQFQNYPATFQENVKTSYRIFQRRNNHFSERTRKADYSNYFTLHIYRQKCNK